MSQQARCSIPRKFSALDLPPALVATQRTTILRSLCPRPPVWRNQLHASARQFCIQSVRFVGVVADETRRELPDEPVRERGLHQSDFMRRGTLDVDSNREPLTIRDGHDLRPLAALRLAHHAGPSLLSWREAPVDERFLQVQMAFVVESLGEHFHDAPQHARAYPLLKPPVAGLI
jgi:hypothetical protein